MTQNTRLLFEANLNKKHTVVSNSTAHKQNCFSVLYQLLFVHQRWGEIGRSDEGTAHGYTIKNVSTATLLYFYPTSLMKTYHEWSRTVNVIANHLLYIDTPSSNKGKKNLACSDCCYVNIRWVQTQKTQTWTWQHQLSPTNPHTPEHNCASAVRNNRQCVTAPWLMTIDALKCPRPERHPSLCHHAPNNKTPNLQRKPPPSCHNITATSRLSSLIMSPAHIMGPAFWSFILSLYVSSHLPRPLLYSVKFFKIIDFKKKKKRKNWQNKARPAVVYTDSHTVMH